MENFRSKQFISLKLHTFLSTVMKSCVTWSHLACHETIPLCTVATLFMILTC
jgi:hypothetical protein